MITQSQETTQESVVPLTGEYPLARVDLMPPEVLEVRRLRRAQTFMVLGVLVVVGGLGAGWYTAQLEVAEAQEELALEQARTADLQTEAAQYATVPAILASVDRAQTALETAMATDLPWYQYLAQIGQSAPTGVWFQSVTAAAVVPGSLAGDPLAPGDVVAELSTTGRALSYPDVATWMDSLDGISNLEYVLFTNATLDEESGTDPWVDFTATAKVEPEAFSDRYSREGQ